jgi:hypothetical protein
MPEARRGPVHHQRPRLLRAGAHHQRRWLRVHPVSVGQGLQDWVDGDVQELGASTGSLTHT